MKLDYSFWIIWVWSEPQHVFKYMGYLKSFFYYHYSVIPTILKNPNATAYFQCAQDDVKRVKPTWTLKFSEKYMFLRRK